jgi:hypothetical protein
MLAREHERKGTTCSAVVRQIAAPPGGAIIMSKLSALSAHPFRNASLCVVIGVVSFVLASTVMPQGAHILWPALFWFLIPLIMLVTAVTLLVVGIVRRFSHASA